MTRSGYGWTRLYTAPLAGGTPRRLAAVCEGQIIYSGAYAYWVDRRPDNLVAVTRRTTSWTEVTGHSRVIRTSLADGSSLVVRTGVPIETMLEPLDTGISWRERRPYPDSRMDLAVYDAGRSLGVLRDYRGFRTSPVSLDGRLYWFACHGWPPYVPPEAPNWTPDEIRSARLDGSDERVELRAASMPGNPIECGTINPTYLYARRGVLYLLARERAETYDPSRYLEAYVCRLSPGTPARLSTLASLPGKTYSFLMDGDAVVFGMVEDPAPWASIFRNASPTYGTYRMRLPN